MEQFQKVAIQNKFNQSLPNLIYTDEVTIEGTGKIKTVTLVKPLGLRSSAGDDWTAAYIRPEHEKVDTSSEDAKVKVFTEYPTIIPFDELDEKCKAEILRTQARGIAVQ